MRKKVLGWTLFAIGILCGVNALYLLVLAGGYVADRGGAFMSLVFAGLLIWGGWKLAHWNGSRK